MELKRQFAPLFLAAALITAVVPGVYAKETAAEAPRVVNINTADASTLASLKGIGDAKAQAIIEYRKQHGPFKSPEQLTEVKGIGDALIATNRDRISVK